MSDLDHITDIEAIENNAALTAETPALLVDLDWTHRVTEEGTSRYTYPRDLFNNYMALIKVMGIAVFISVPSQPVGVYNAKIAGLFFSGGRDMHPQFYNEPVNGTRLTSSSESRFLLAKEEYKWAHKHKLPILGVCWGSQFLAVVAGGSLVQDLPEEQQHISRMVPLSVDPDSWLGRAIEGSGLSSSCHHHQGFKHIPPSFHIIARDADGSPHAFQSRRGPLHLGFLGHPERLLDDEATLKFARAFGEHCLKHALGGAEDSENGAI